MSINLFINWSTNNKRTLWVTFPNEMICSHKAFHFIICWNENTNQNLIPPKKDKKGWAVNRLCLVHFQKILEGQCQNKNRLTVPLYIFLGSTLYLCMYILICYLLGKTLKKLYILWQSVIYIIPPNPVYEMIRFFIPNYGGKNK